MRAVYILQRTRANARWHAAETGAPEAMSLSDALRLATRGGAYCVGLSDRIGTLAPGKQADVIAVRADALGLGPLNNALGTVVLGASPANVETVMVGGVLRKAQGKLVGVDSATLMRRLTASRDRLAQAAGLWQRSDIVRMR
jgi:5-methylthioadenosine/S-adenosylhomocysteine deaminase